MSYVRRTPARIVIEGPSVAVHRRRRNPLADVDPSRVPPPYGAAVEDALRPKAQFADLLGSMRGGPLRDRMGELGARIDAGVLAV